MYIFIPSYPSFFFGLKKIKEGGTVTILTNNKSVKRLCDKLSLDVVFYKFDYGLYGVYQGIKKLKSILSSIDDSKRDFYLLDNSFSLDGFYLAENWTKGVVFYQNLSMEFSLYKKEITLKNKIKKLVFSCVLGFDLIFREYNGLPVFGIDDFFIERNKFKHLNITHYNDLKKEVIKNFQIEDKSVDYLWVSQGDLNGIVSSTSFEIILSNLFTDFNLALKEHPMHKSKIDFEYYYQIDDYIPVEFYLGNVTKAVISVYSLSLLSVNNFKGLKAISLLELLDWKDFEFKKNMKDSLIRDSGNTIIFPSSLEELNELLK